ncbi:hypothetical protein N9O95_02980 [Alphaproteobacteria bacterium]|nr:hypothetical protein [Alphaproteobacteria bacterium]
MVSMRTNSFCTAKTLPARGIKPTTRRLTSAPFLQEYPVCAVDFRGIPE